MREHLGSKYIMPLLFIILLITAGIFVPFLLYAQGKNASPSFPRQEVNDEIHDVKQFVGIENDGQKRDDYNKNPLSESVDIQRISYSSDGNFLNGTLWVGGSGVKENPSLYGASGLAYGMLIDAD